MSGVGAKAGPRRALMLGLGPEIVAIEAGLVREIIDPVPETPVAGARPHLAAVINVRGNVIPLADIRLRFGLPVTPATRDTRIVVMEIVIDGDPAVVGIVADRVHEVAEIDVGAMQPTPRAGMAWRPEFIRGFTRWNDAFVIVPDLAAILN